MKIWILGSKGLVGTSLVPKLHAHEVIATDRVFDVRVMQEDYPDVDLIINLAALNSTKESIDNPREYFDVNVKGNFNILEIAREIGAKYLYLTTMKEVETSPYAVSKHCASSWIECYRQTYGMNAIINMVGNLYGPHGDNFWVNIFMKKAKDKQQIEVYGDGSASRDMLYIEDLTDLLVDQINNFDKYSKHSLIPVGGGEDNILSVKGLLDWLQYENVTYKEDLGMQHDRVTNNSRVTAINGWKPTTTIDEGLKMTYDTII